MNIRLTPQEQAVLDVLGNLETATNEEIARATGIPEPSVRRATRNLETKSRIYVRDNYGNSLVWKTVTPPVAHVSGY